MSVELAVRFITESGNAVKLYDFATETEHWIPLSQVEEMHKPVGAFPKDGTIIMTDWIAKQKGLVE